VLEELDVKPVPDKYRTTTTGRGDPVAAKTARIEMRVDPDTGAKIAQAAEIEGKSVSAFVLDAATAAADRVLARIDHVVMPAAQFDALLDSLDTPEDAPTLRKLAQRERRFRRA
jgi:uncharacterized protein (DUF1778 family)